MTETIPVTHLQVGDYVVLDFKKADTAEFDLQSVAVRFADIAGVHIDSQDDLWIVTISLLSHTSMPALDIARQFANGLIDQKLRSVIAQKTEMERNLILSYAFSNTRLVTQGSDSDDGA